jgi:glutamate/tyrosine decarboxylase-like PLP-dependent enzyme
MDKLLLRVAEYVAAYRASLPDRPVNGSPVSLDGALQRRSLPPGQVIDELIAAAEPGLAATAGPRFFGFVIGGALPAATAADMLAAGWDQCAFNAVLSPAAAAAEQAAGGWLKALLGIPQTASVGFVTGAQAANTAGLAAARQYVYGQAGWDVAANGLVGAPRIPVLASEERHATIDRSLRLLGLGTDTITPVRADANGAIDIADLRAKLTGPAIVCLQSGNVNTGACDDLRAACAAVHEYGGWAHVDGAFGLWAAASPATRHLVDGVELADSWGTDGHKWLNVPYDSAFAFCSRPRVAADAMSYTASYLVGSGTVNGMADLTAESSRRARGFAVWAALRELGTDGVAALVDRCCALARRFAAGLQREAGAEIVNDIVLNQALVSFGDSRTDRLVEAIQADGTCWLGATTWQGRRLVRISVSNAATTGDDIDRSVAAIARLAAGIR